MPDTPLPAPRLPEVFLWRLAGLPRRLGLQPPGAAPEGEAAQRETAAAPEVPAEPVQLLHLHPQPLLPLGRR
ncbi:hypothetical protein EK904_000144 [Melospiza melodia maxima]|nr:hypothetical protein EK904_000144 [Melospiza melodia maxima]